MSQNLNFILGVIAGGIVAWIFWILFINKKSNNASEKPLENNAKPGQTIIEKEIQEHQKNKQKILDFLAKTGKNPITNNDIQNLIGFSDASAERYLNELEKEGALKQVGKTDVKVYYTKP